MSKRWRRKSKTSSLQFLICQSFFSRLLLLFLTSSFLFLEDFVIVSLAFCVASVLATSTTVTITKTRLATQQLTFVCKWAFSRKWRGSTTARG